MLEQKGNPPVPKCRILFISSTPTDASRLRPEEEEKKIREVLKQADNRDDFNFISVSAATIDDLRRALAGSRPTVVFFSGHGLPNLLTLENEHGKSVNVTANDISEILKHFRCIECVVLSACYSEKTAKALCKHIPYVVGTSEMIEVGAAVRFATLFFSSLFGEHDYETAFSLAKVQVRAEGFHDFDSAIHLYRKTRILTPRPPELIPSGLNQVTGIAGDDFGDDIYLATGGGPDLRYWPSIRGKPQVGPDRKWSGFVHVGLEKPNARISLLRVNEATAEYVEFYRRHAEEIGYRGLVLARQTIEVLDNVLVEINLMPLRTRLVGDYDEFDADWSPTGKKIAISLEGEWAIRLKCTNNDKVQWESVVMMEDENPNIGKGVYTYLASPGIPSGHHRIAYQPADKTIRIDGYAFDSGKARKWAKTTTLIPGARSEPAN